MREYLFRGKRVDNGEWIYGDLLTPTDIMYDWEISENTGMGNRYDIDPETVGQYTGLTDKNGKKIFEGDILTFAKGATRPFRIAWDGLGWKMFLLDDGRRIKYAYEIDEIDYMRRSEIIGNIHDNPELLEVKE